MCFNLMTFRVALCEIIRPNHARRHICSGWMFPKWRRGRKKWRSKPCKARWSPLKSRRRTRWKSCGRCCLKAKSVKIRLNVNSLRFWPRVCWWMMTRRSCPLGFYVRNRMWRSFTLEDWWKKSIHEGGLRWRSQSLWHPLGRTPLTVAQHWHVSLSLTHWQSLNKAPSQIVSLESVIIPDLVIVVGAAAFVDWKALKHITLSRSLASNFKEHFRRMWQFDKNRHPWLGQGHWKVGLFPLQVIGKSRHAILCKTNWWVRIGKLRGLGARPYIRVRDSHWEACFCRMWISVRALNPWVGWNPWWLCLSRLWFFRKAPCRWRSAYHWPRCVYWLSIFDEHLDKRFFDVQCGRSIWTRCFAEHHLISW